jgi:hypothetical protein
MNRDAEKIQYLWDLSVRMETWSGYFVLQTSVAQQANGRGRNVNVFQMEPQKAKPKRFENDPILYNGSRHICFWW